MKTKRTSTQTGLMALALLLLFMAVYFLVRAIITFATPSSAWQPAPVSPAMQARSVKQAAPALDLTFDPFFRDAPQGALVDSGATDDAPETTLNLTVIGLISGNKGRVILQMSDGRQHSFSVGDEILNGVTLDAIYDDHIVLSQNGEKERLTFVRSDEDGPLAGAPKTSTASRRGPDTRSAARMRAERAVAMAGSGGFNVETLLRAVQVSRVNEKGRIQGYKIRSRGREFDLKQFNLQDDDILVKVGNVDLTRGDANWLGAFQNLAVTGGGSAKIIRNGREMTIRVKTP